MSINENRRIEINGVFQHITILSQNRNLPLLVYVHGGPGDGALPMLLKYQSELADHYTFVIWEQRGAGKSYYAFGVNETVKIDDYVEDLHVLVGYLTKRFDQKQVYLLAHDTGTIIGLKYIMKYPETVKKYIGCSQVVNMEKTMRLRLRYAIENSSKSVANKLLQIDPTFSSPESMKDLNYLDKQITKLKGNLYNQKTTLSHQHIYLRCGFYTLFDYRRYLLGMEQTSAKLWKEIMTIDFEQVTKLPVPVVFVEGRHDKRLSSALARTYYDKLTSAKEWYWFERSSHFPQWCEPEAFNELMIRIKE
ncbi:alpha/beta fold hydrolase [uncultured Dubosiella sp.]|jgi:pimeloyl-ACP methyl ester carboxylesterase|uniref:alpha/beta fold hydrolase n=1 Tax=uncultured Dubosiella sp. TaxID=1937011 RepID=UPI002083C598|nr:alpha/beta hydrolase [uncultured Dubosiella sp.]GJM56965.1 alpha/beta hydrolase [Erysipelotrichaceae bacterium OPF54]